MDRLAIIMGLICLLASCQTAQRQMEPIIVYTPPPHRIEKMPSAFPPLTEGERTLEWAKELIVGDVFAKELDLYRAITFYKRARILLPPEAIERRLQIDYDIILCYYLGQKYCEAINALQESPLINANPSFPAYNNLIMILYECYIETKQEEKAQTLFEFMEKCSPETARDLSLYFHLKKGEIEEAQADICSHPQSEEFQPHFDLYYRNAKSPEKARQLNAILPGAGYYYVGQKKSAVTSFVINALFTAAAYQFFHRGYVAAGIITTSLEAGWYLGGINGAGIEAQEFNKRLYEETTKNMMICNDFFPVLMFETAF